MSQLIDAVNLNQDSKPVQRVRLCRSFLCRLRGLTFRRQLPNGVGLLLDEGAQSRLGTAIHMLAVFMPLGVAWLNDSFQVVDLTLAKPWRFYFPDAPARYILEGNTAMLESLAIGDHLELKPVEA